ncbi:MAG: sugar phosphate isomerase/epimerase [Clostridia bacterium]|nr:sugar phosphate isomerase/epimerase [Clostridia bacterium]
MFPIGMSTSGLDPTEEVLADYAREGITHIEVSIGNDDFDRIDWPTVRALCGKYGITLWSVHLPFAPFTLLDPSSLDEGRRVFTVDRFRALMAAAAAVGADKFVVHASAEPIPDAERAARMAQSKRSMAELADYAAGLGAVVCVEDLPRTCLGHDSAELLDLLSADDRLRCCLDTNHLLSEELPDFIRAVGEKIVTLHVSDYDRVNERHWLPGEGVIRWPAVLDALRSVGYDGPWMYEIGLATPGTIIRDRELTRRDFYVNAHELFDGRPLTTFSHPKPDLGMWG